jgi:hypothetical protein
MTASEVLFYLFLAFTIGFGMLGMIVTYRSPANPYRRRKKK